MFGFKKAETTPRKTIIDRRYLCEKCATVKVGMGELWELENRILFGSAEKCDGCNMEWARVSYALWV